jgi:uncharacterized protein
MGAPVVHFEVIGRDGAALRSFYSRMFDWELQEIGGPTDYGVVQRDGNTLDDGTGIGGGIGGGEHSDHVTFYVQVADIRAALAKAEELGGRRVSEPDEVPGAGILIAQLTDPEGHLIGLVQPVA